VHDVAAALARYHRRIGSRWRGHAAVTQAVLTCAYLEGGHTYRKLAAGNDIPKCTCYDYLLLTQHFIGTSRRNGQPIVGD
jgi:hypothetical protein